MINELIKKLYTNKTLIAEEKAEERLLEYIDDLNELKSKVLEALNVLHNDYFIVNGEHEIKLAYKFFRNYNSNGSWHYETTYIIDINEKGLRKLDKELKKYNLGWESE